MSKIFQSKPGMVQVVDLGDGGGPGVLSISGAGNLASQQGVVITGIGVDQRVNIQFVSSLQKVIYVYSFGDKMGQITVSGLAFHKICPGNGQQGYLGAQSLLEYYDKNRAISEDRLMKVSIGGYAIQGYMVSANLQTSSAEFKTMAFTLNIISVPKQIGVS